MNKNWWDEITVGGTFIPKKGWPQIKEFTDKLYLKQKGKCFYCDRTMTRFGDNTKTDFCCEHLTPLSRGGKDHPDNIVGACNSCNTKKRNRTMEEFVEHMKAKGTLTARLAGKIGGRKTAQTYGTKHFKKIAKQRHSTKTGGDNKGLQALA